MQALGDKLWSACGDDGSQFRTVVFEAVLSKLLHVPLMRPSETQTMLTTLGKALLQVDLKHRDLKTRQADAKGKGKGDDDNVLVAAIAWLLELQGGPGRDAKDTGHRWRLGAIAKGFLQAASSSAPLASVAVANALALSTLARVKDRSADVRLLAVQTVNCLSRSSTSNPNVGDQSFELLLERAWNDCDAEVRASAVTTLLEILGESLEVAATTLEPVLARAASDVSPKVRRSLLKCIFELNDIQEDDGSWDDNSSTRLPQVFCKLVLQSLADRNRSIRLVAADIVLQLAGRNQLPQLCRQTDLAASLALPLSAALAALARQYPTHKGLRRSLEVGSAVARFVKEPNRLHGVLAHVATAATGMIAGSTLEAAEPDENGEKEGSLKLFLLSPAVLVSNVERLANVARRCLKLGLVFELRQTLFALHASSLPAENSDRALSAAVQVSCEVLLFLPTASLEEELRRERPFPSRLLGLRGEDGPSPNSIMLAMQLLRQLVVQHARGGFAAKTPRQAEARFSSLALRVIDTLQRRRAEAKRDDEEDGEGSADDLDKSNAQQEDRKQKRQSKEPAAAYLLRATAAATAFLALSRVAPERDAGQEGLLADLLRPAVRSTELGHIGQLAAVRGIATYASKSAEQAAGHWRFFLGVLESGLNQLYAPWSVQSGRGSPLQVTSKLAEAALHFFTDALLLYDQLLVEDCRAQVFVALAKVSQAIDHALEKLSSSSTSSLLPSSSALRASSRWAAASSAPASSGASMPMPAESEQQRLQRGLYQDLLATVVDRTCTLLMTGGLPPKCPAAQYILGRLLALVCGSGGAAFAGGEGRGLLQQLQSLTSLKERTQDKPGYTSLLPPSVAQAQAKRCKMLNSKEEPHHDEPEEDVDDVTISQAVLASRLLRFFASLGALSQAHAELLLRAGAAYFAARLWMGATAADEDTARHSRNSPCVRAARLLCGQLRRWPALQLRSLQIIADALLTAPLGEEAQLSDALAAGCLACAAGGPSFDWADKGERGPLAEALSALLCTWQPKSVACEVKAFASDLAAQIPAGDGGREWCSLASEEASNLRQELTSKGFAGRLIAFSKDLGAADLASKDLLREPTGATKRARGGENEEEEEEEAQPTVPNSSAPKKNKKNKSTTTAAAAAAQQQQWFLKDCLSGEQTALPAAGELTIGRAASCDLVVNDSAVTGRHCVVLSHRVGHQLEDLSTRNGTFVNNRRVLPGAAVELKEGDVLALASRTGRRFILEKVVMQGPIETGTPEKLPHPKRRRLRSKSANVSWDQLRQGGDEDEEVLEEEDEEKKEVERAAAKAEPSTAAVQEEQMEEQQQHEESAAPVPRRRLRCKTKACELDTGFGGDTDMEQDQPPAPKPQAGGATEAAKTDKDDQQQSLKSTPTSKAGSKKEEEHAARQTKQQPKQHQEQPQQVQHDQSKQVNPQRSLPPPKASGSLNKELEEKVALAVFAADSDRSAAAIMPRLVDLQTGALHTLPSNGVATVGRRSDCEVVVKDINISSRHCVLLCSHGRVQLEDISSNGTFVNETRVPKGFSLPQHVTLMDGDRISLAQKTGSTFLFVAPHRR